MAYELVFVGIILLLLVAVTYLIRSMRQLKASIKALRSARTGDSVRHGNAWEQFLPFMDGYPYEPGNFRFLGSPIDGISFEEEGIVFIEIKTGKSRLSGKQSRIREQVEQGKVSFRTIRH